MAYNDDESPVTVTLNGEPMEEGFLLPGNCEATYTISAKDSAGNETVYTVYMKPISSITNGLGNLSEDTVTSADSTLVTGTETRLLDIAGAFDENESTEAEWDELKAALDLCKKLQGKIEETSEKLDTLRAAINGYSTDTVSEKDRENLEKLVTNAKKLLSSSNLTQSERAETETLLSTANVLLEKIGGSNTTPTQPDQPGANPDRSQEPATKVEKLSTSPKTGDTSDAILWTALLLISGGILTGMTVLGRKKSR